MKKFLIGLGIVAVAATAISAAAVVVMMHEAAKDFTQMMQVMKQN